MPFEFYIAFRYLVAKRRQAFVSVISMISMLGVAVGVMALVIALAMTTGVQGEMRDRLLASTAHVYVWPGDTGLVDYQADVRKLMAMDGVVGVGPAILGKAMIKSDSAETFINVKGIDPVLEPKVTEIQQTMQEGDVGGLAAVDGVPGIVLGKDLAAYLMVRVGDQVNLITPQATLTPAGMRTTARSRQARVAGIFSLRLLEFDSTWGFVSLDFAASLKSRPGPEPELLQLRVSDPFAAAAIAEKIPALMGNGYSAQDWQDLNQSLFSALWMEKMAISLAISLIVIVAALQIVASLVLMVLEKSHDIGILKTMGTSTRSISTIFMLQGLAIGVVGTAVGGVLSLALCWVLNTYKLVHIPMDVYQVTYIPFIVEARDFVVVVIGAVLVSFLATIYPSRQAARLDPVQALRFE
jgi:lipoprotein-releasing system permease protein